MCPIPQNFVTPKYQNSQTNLNANRTNKIAFAVIIPTKLVSKDVQGDNVVLSCNLK